MKGEPSYFACPICGSTRFGTFVMEETENSIKSLEERAIKCNGYHCEFTIPQDTWEALHPERTGSERETTREARAT